MFGEDGQLRQFVDGRGSSSSWMSYVNCARCPAEQNVNMVQSRDGHLYYDVVDDIPYNAELLVTHTRTYALFSERELRFTFAICYRPSVCRLSVCRL